MTRPVVGLPKVHLHVHLEGTIRPSTLVEIAARHGAHAPDSLRDDRYAFADLAGVRERQIPLEVSPSINVTTGIYPSLAEHPLPRLLEAGLVVTLNADVPAMIATSLAREYQTAREVFGLDDQRLAAIARACVRASFLEATPGLSSWLRLTIGSGYRAPESARSPDDRGYLSCASQSRATAAVQDWSMEPRGSAV